MNTLLSTNLFSMRRYTAILMVSMVIPLVLSSCFKKDTPIVESPTTAQEWELSLAELEALFASGAQVPYSIHSGGILELTAELQTGRGNILEMIASLTWNDINSIDKRAYLKSYMGDYSWALAEKDILCKKDATLCPKPSITLDIGGIQNQSWESLNNIRISIDGKSISHDSAIIQPEVYDNMVHRVRVEKEWYLDSYAKLNHVPGGSTELPLNPVLAKADSIVEMDNQVGGTYTAGEWTGAITYTIAPDTFANASWKIIQWKVMVYLFALDKNDEWLSTFQLDTFSNSWTRLGNGMITNGMPFVTAYKDGKEIDNVKPIEGIGVMSPSITAMDLVNVPKNTWLPNSELERFGLPGYWALDRKTGVWKESKMQILDTLGGYKFQL